MHVTHSRGRSARRCFLERCIWGVEQALRSLCAKTEGTCVGTVCSAPSAVVLQEERLTMSQTWNPKKIPRRRKHGFLSRMATKNGRHVLKARRNKGRWKLSVSDERRHVARGHR